MGWPEIMIWGGFAAISSMVVYAKIHDPEKGEEDVINSLLGACLVITPLFSIAIGARLLVWEVS